MDPGSGIQNRKHLDPGCGIRDGKNSDPGYRIWDKDPESAKLDLENRAIIEPFVEKAFWDETKSFLQSKAASVALKRGKTPVN